MESYQWAIAGVTIVAGVISTLLARKDNQQAEFIKDLYLKHHEDAKALADMQRDLDRNYHPKEEIKELFNQQRQHIDERFDRIERAMGMDRRGKGCEV